MHIEALLKQKNPNRAARGKILNLGHLKKKNQFQEL